MATALEAAELAQRLAKSMPTGPGTDKELWVDDMTEIFQNFALRDVEFAVKDPMNGVRASHKWLPSIVEVKEFLNGLAVRRGRIISNARRVVARYDEQTQDPVQSPERRAAVSKKLEELAVSLRARKIIEPVAGRDPVDIEAQQRRKKALAELASRRASRSVEELDEDARIAQRLYEIRERRTA